MYDRPSGLMNTQEYSLLDMIYAYYAYDADKYSL